MRGGVSCAAAALSLALLASGALAQALQPIPALHAHVTDLTSTLSASERDALEQKLAAFEARKGAQIAVLIVETTQPEEPEQYGIRVAEAWKLGRAHTDDGALLLVAKGDRAVRIEVGYGLEGVLTDAMSRRIQDDTIVPHFRSGDYAGGIDAGVDRMIALIDGESLPPPETNWDREAPSRIGRLFPLLFVGFPIVSLLRRIFGRVLGPLFAGGIVFALAWLITGTLALALLFGVVAALFSAFSGLGPTRRYGGGGWGGGFGGGGFGGGGFGGGFSGGGGGFGGGGATSRW